MTLDNSLVKAIKATVIWNHIVAIRFLHASFELGEFCTLLALVVSINLMHLEIQNPTSSLKKFASLKYQIMTSLNPKEILNGDLVVNRCK